MAKGSSTVKETEEERALAQIAAEKYNTFKQLYDPQIDRYIDMVRMDENDYGYGRAEISTSLGLQARENEKEAIRRGLDPRRSASAFLESTAGVGGAMTAQQSFRDIDKEIDSVHYRGLESVAKLGQGISQSAQRGITDIAKETSDIARHNAMQDFEYRAGNQRAIGKIAGWAADEYDSEGFGEKINVKNSYDYDMPANGGYDQYYDGTRLS